MLCTILSVHHCVGYRDLLRTTSELPTTFRFACGADRFYGWAGIESRDFFTCVPANLARALSKDLLRPASELAGRFSDRGPPSPRSSGGPRFIL